MHDWDTAVALAYAAEELLFAAQALSSELISADVSRGLAHRHVHGLAQHEGQIPSAISIQLRNLESLYTDWEDSRATPETSRMAVRLATIAVLDGVRDLLQDEQPREKGA